MFSGLRRGEFLALTEKTLFRDYLKVSYSLKRYYKSVVGNDPAYIKVDYFADPKNKTALYLTRPKTKKGLREVPFNSDVEIAFNNLRLYQETQRTTDIDYNRFDFLVCRPDGQCYDPDLFSEKIKNYLIEVTKPLNKEDENIENSECATESKNKSNKGTHKLRHHCATTFCALTSDIATVSEMLGHAKVSTTLDMYCHSNLDKKRQLVAEVKMGA